MLCLNCDVQAGEGEQEGGGVVVRGLPKPCASDPQCFKGVLFAAATSLPLWKAGLQHACFMFARHRFLMHQVIRRPQPESTASQCIELARV